MSCRRGWRLTFGWSPEQLQWNSVILSHKRIFLTITKKKFHNILSRCVKLLEWKSNMLKEARSRDARNGWGIETSLFSFYSWFCPWLQQSPLIRGDMFRDPQQISEAMDNTLYAVDPWTAWDWTAWIYQNTHFFSIYIYIGTFFDDLQQFEKHFFP